MAQEIAHEPKRNVNANQEDALLSQVIEFIRQSHAKKASGGFWGSVKVYLTYEAGELILTDLNDGATLKRKKK